MVPNFVPSDETNRCQDMAIFRLLKMATVRHLGFVMRVFGPPGSVLSDLYRCAKFGWSRH